MLRNKVILCCIGIFASLFTKTLCNPEKVTEALGITLETTLAFFLMYEECIYSTMPSLKFATDDLKSFVNYPSKTTVGFAPKFTANRKFFANMISTPEFKNMLARDEEELRQNMVKKMQYCDTVIMDQDLLQPMYDREVDQTKLKK